MLPMSHKPPVKDILQRKPHFLALFVEQGIYVDIDTYLEALAR